MKHQGNFKMGFLIGMFAGAAGALVYFKNRKVLRRELWKLRARAEIHERLVELKRITRDNFERVVDDVVMRYRAAEHIAVPEAEAFIEKMKDQYEWVRKHVEPKIKAAMDGKDDDDEDEDEK
jgi:hypothetical protein